jgi:hypothetical protein
MEYVATLMRVAQIQTTETKGPPYGGPSELEFASLVRRLQ